MTLAEVFTLGALGLQSTGLAIVLFKLIWGGAASHQSQFNALERACSEGIAACRNEFLAKLELASSNVGNVVSNIGNRIHDLELKAMEVRAIAAETYMRRDSYHKATDEFKRDVRDAHNDLKQEMHAGFDAVKDQIGAVSMSIEENRKAAVHRGLPAS